jgi:hypothetical protein
LIIIGEEKIFAMIIDLFFKNSLSCTMIMRKLAKTEQTGAAKEREKDN